MREMSSKSCPAEMQVTDAGLEEVLVATVIAYRCACTTGKLELSHSDCTDTIILKGQLTCAHAGSGASGELCCSLVIPGSINLSPAKPRLLVLLIPLV